MIGEMRRALGQQHRQTGWMIDQRHQHGRGGQAGTRRQGARVQRMVAAQTGRRRQVEPRRPTGIGWANRASTNSRVNRSRRDPERKNFPWLHTPNTVA